MRKEKRVDRAGENKFHRARRRRRSRDDSPAAVEMRHPSRSR